MIDSFFKTNNLLQPEKGRILLSQPLLDDFYFSQSIILLTEINEEGILGFVINHPLKVKLKSLFPDFPDFKGRISLGGPVASDSMQFIYRAKQGLPGAIPIMEDLYWGGDFDSLQEWIILEKLDYRDILFFLGIQENTWIVSEMSVSTLLSARKNLWNNSLEKMGNKYKAWANFPLIPEMN